VGTKTMVVAGVRHVERSYYVWIAPIRTSIDRFSFRRELLPARDKQASRFVFH
jgi:hypothetical protein